MVFFLLDRQVSCRWQVISEAHCSLVKIFAMSDCLKKAVVLVVERAFFTLFPETFPDFIHKTV